MKLKFQNDGLIEFTTSYERVTVQCRLGLVIFDD